MRNIKILLKILLVFSLVGMVLGMALGMAGCQSGPRPAQASGWQIATVTYPAGTQQFYTLSQYPWGAGQLPDGTVWLNFPSYATPAQAAIGPNVTRLWKLYSKPGTFNGPYTAYTFNTTLTGSPVFFWQTEAVNTCNTPAGAHPMFVAFYTGNFVPTVEWWTNPDAYTLAPGLGQLQVPLTPELWSDEDGHFANSSPAALAAFGADLTNLNVWGMSFGGGCFFGHGVSTTGTGTAKLEVQMEPNPQ